LPAGARIFVQVANADQALMVLWIFPLICPSKIRTMMRLHARIIGDTRETNWSSDC
jgi:hypothetical protein